MLVTGNANHVYQQLNYKCQGILNPLKILYLHATLLITTPEACGIQTHDT